MQPRRHTNYDVYRESARAFRRSVSPDSVGQSIDGITPVRVSPAHKPVLPKKHVAPPHLRTIHPTGIVSISDQPHSPKAREALRPKPAIQWKAAVLSVMALAIFVTGGVVSYMNWRTNQQVAAWVDTQSEEENGDDSVAHEEPAPDETKPTGNPSAYRVAADMPRMLRIGELKIAARIKPLGVKNNNELKAPSNIHDVGWYESSAKPGLGGTTLLDGHVHGPTKPGVFFGLKDLKEGSLIEVERGDGQKFSYKVVKTQKYEADKVDMAAALTPVIAGKEGLNLVTCTGRLDKKTNTYDDRLVIFATLVD